MGKSYLKIAGIINLMTALVHLIAGQVDLVNPLNNNNLEIQHIAEWVGVWHLVTVLLFYTSFQILKLSFSKIENLGLQQLKPLGFLYVLAGIPFIISSIYYSVLAPQWILLIPIGIFLIIGTRKLALDVK